MTFAVALDFSTKQERTVTLDDVNDARARGSYCWIDLHAPSDDELRKFLESLKIGHEPIEDIQRRISDGGIIAWFSAV